MLIVFILCKISRFLNSACFAWNYLFTPNLGSFMGILLTNKFRFCRNLQKYRPWAKHVVWAINRENLFTGSTWRRARENIQYNQQRKSHKTVIIIHLSRESGEAAAEWIEMKICTGVDVVDILMDVKLKFEKFQGFWCNGGSKFALSIHCARGSYHSAALPRCLW